MKQEVSEGFWSLQMDRFLEGLSLGEAGGDLWSSPSPSPARSGASWS